MMSQEKKILSILLVIALSSLGQAFADVEVDQDLDIDVLPTVTITKSAESQENGTLSFANGNITGDGVKSVFTLQTNGTDDDYEFVMSSTIQVDGNIVSAYTPHGDILFGNITVLPTTEAVNNAKSRLTGNANVIAYPVTVLTEGSMTSEFHYNNATYGDYYKIMVNNDQEQRKVTHRINSTPVTNSYNVSEDEAGTYQAIITFTSVAK